MERERERMRIKSYFVGILLGHLFSATQIPNTIYVYIYIYAKYNKTVIHVTIPCMILLKIIEYSFKEHFWKTLKFG